MTEQQAEQQWGVGHDPQLGYYIRVPGKGAVADGIEKYIRQAVADHNALQVAASRITQLEAALAEARKDLEYIGIILGGNVNGDDIAAARRILHVATSRLTPSPESSEAGQ